MLINAFQIENTKNIKKQYYETNKEAISEKIKQYSTRNKEAIIEKRTQLFICECSGQCTLRHKARHNKSKKHLDFIASKSQ